jgi:cation transport protein ChaC
MLLWRREMVTGAYAPRWLGVDCGGRQVTALGFVVRRDHPQYAGKLAIDAQADVVARARGAFGSSADYLERTRVALVTHGIVEPYLERLAVRVAAKRVAAMGETA